MFANNYISTIVENQLPEFIRSDHPNFVALFKRYYEYLEQADKTLGVNKKLYDYMDVDETRTDLIKYFKTKILPNFPEETALSTAKIVKASKDFYTKKGTPDSFKFIFRVLYGQEAQVYFPKEDILKASDGKWKQPQALRLAFSDTSRLVTGGNVNVAGATANVVVANGINLITKGVTVNSYIRIGEEKRKVINVHPTGANLTVEIPFANTSTTSLIYDSQKLYQLTLSEYVNFNIKLLEKRQGVGEISRTTCIIEKGVLTIDEETGREIVEIYVSNVKRLFEPGENLVVEYVDENGDTKTFKSKIVSLISNLSLFRNRFGVVQTGRKYVKGDPVVIYGGLADTGDAAKAIAVVNNVSTGSIESVDVVQQGYLFRDSPNSLVRIFSTTGIGANLEISGIWDDGGANSAVIEFNTDAIVYKGDLPINDDDYGFDNVSAIVGFTINPGNTVTTVNLSTTSYTPSLTTDFYKSFALKITAGTGSSGSPNSATIISYNPTTKIATLGTALAVAPDATSNVRIYANAQTEIGRALSFEQITLGKIRALDLIDGGSFFETPPTFDAISLYDSDYSVDEGFMLVPKGDFSDYNPNSEPPSIRLNSSNPNYNVSNGFYTGTRLFLDVGDTAHFATVLDYIVNNVGDPVNMTKTLYLDRKFENNINPTNILNFNLFFDYRPNVRNPGKIGTILVKKGGSGYSTSDNVSFIGTGYNANAYLTVTGGVITGITLDNRGEGYPIAPGIIITNGSGPSAGSGAEFDVFLLSDGELFSAGTGDIGRIQDFRIINRGFDYANTPIVSLKIVDVLTDNITTGQIVIEGDSVWQGGITNAGATFTGTVDGSYKADSTNTVIRVFDYSGSINTSEPLRIATTTGNIAVNIATGNTIVSFNDINDAVERKYPFFYGDGLAKANAEFLNGLIKYNGFYLTTDGFLSADKKLQNKDYYHNFSYEIESEKSLDEYKETINRVAHPAGMHLLSRYLAKDIISDKNTIKSNVHSSNTAETTNANTSFSSNVFYGNVNSQFLTTTNIGDIVIINTSTTAAYRKYSRLIEQVISDTELYLESPIGGLGDGKFKTTAACNEIKLYSNVSAIGESLQTGDNVRFKISSTIFDREIIGISGNTITVNATVSLSGNVLYTKIPTYNVVGFDIIKTNG